MTEQQAAYERMKEALELAHHSAINQSKINYKTTSKITEALLDLKTLALLTVKQRPFSIKELAALYIAQEMKWSKEATEYEKILVCGNLQGFAAYVDNVSAPKDAWVLVPVKPTHEMIVASLKEGIGHISQRIAVYKAMISAAPQPAKGE